MLVSGSISRSEEEDLYAGDLCGISPKNWRKQNREQTTEQGCNFGKIPSISLTAEGAQECKLHHDFCAFLGCSQLSYFYLWLRATPASVSDNLNLCWETYPQVFLAFYASSQSIFSSLQTVLWWEFQTVSNRGKLTTKSNQSANAQRGVGCVDITCYIALARPASTTTTGNTYHLYRGGTWSTERLTILPMVTQLLSSRLKIQSKKPVLVPSSCIVLTAAPNPTASMCAIKGILGMSGQDIEGPVRWSNIWWHHNLLPVLCSDFKAISRAIWISVIFCLNNYSDLSNFNQNQKTWL